MNDNIGGKKMSLLPQYNILSSPKQFLNRLTETFSCLRLKGSILLETTIVLPLFVGFMLVLLFFFRVMQVEIDVEQALAYTSRHVAAQSTEKSDTNMAEIGMIFYRQLEQQEIPYQYIQGKRFGISLAKSKCTGNEIELIATYTIRCPISFFGTLKTDKTQRAISRKWIGRTNTGNALAEGYVYITPTGRAYHNTRECAYLDLKIHTSQMDVISKKRNKTGEKYNPCQMCSEKKGLGLVYVTDYGNRYHTSLQCSGLKRTIYIVSLQEIGQRTKCMKCGGM